MFKTISLFLAGLSLLAYSTAGLAEEAAPSATALLVKADEYRSFKGKPFTFDIRLDSKEPGEEDKVFQLKAEILNPHTSLIIYADPSSERGKALLMDQNNLWFHSPSSSKPIRITQQQRLLGEASNGDVASTDFSGDYNPVYLKPETVDGVRCHVLELTAKPDSLATYDKLNLWIRADDAKPVKAEFFAISGKLLKSARYTRYEKLASNGGKEQLMALEIVNPLTEGKKTIMEYSNFQLAELPISRFNASSLDKLR